MIEFYNVLREIREAKGMRKTQVANRLGMHRGAYGKMEATGKPQLTIERLYDLAKIFEMSPADIFNKFENGYDKDGKVLGLLKENALTEPFLLLKKVENGFLEIYEKQICEDILSMFAQRAYSFFHKGSKGGLIKDGEINEVITRYKNFYNRSLSNKKEEHLYYLEGNCQVHDGMNARSVSNILFSLEDIIGNFFSKELRIELSIGHSTQYKFILNESTPPEFVKHEFIAPVIKADLYRDNVLRNTYELSENDRADDYYYGGAE